MDMKINKKIGRPLIGVTRWDALNDNSDNCWVLRALRYDRWNYRSPDFLTRTGFDEKTGSENSQEAIDKQIEYANKSGIDYWAFIDAPNTNVNAAERYALEKYLSSKRKLDLQFSIVMHKFTEKLEPWVQRCDRYIEYMQNPNYVRVMGNRPLIYIFNIYDMEEEFGVGEGVLNAINILRYKAETVGLNPYIVAFSFGIGKAIDEDIARNTHEYRLDALSCYGIPGEGNDGDPFSKLAMQVRKKWETMAATGLKVIPPVSLGWDTRPMQMTPPGWPICPGNWFISPTSSECAELIKAGMDFVVNNPEICEANSILTYSWNEFTEGAWLNPTIEMGTDRLDAIRLMLNDYKNCGG